MVLEGASLLRTVIAGDSWLQVAKHVVQIVVPLVELGLLGTAMAVLYQLRRGDELKKHDALVDGSASPSREPPRDIMKPHFFQNRQGLWIHHNLWWDDKEWGFGRAPAGVAILLHGHSEHSKRFHHVAEKLNAIGIAVFAMDHQGFGRSEGDRCHVEYFEHYVDDVEEFALQVVWGDHPEWRTLPRILVAHSMGGCIAVHSALRFRKSTHEAHKLCGVILSAPALYVDPSRNTWWLRTAASILDRVAPKLPLISFPSYHSTSFLQLKAHACTDPLNYQGNVRIHQGLELVRGTAMALENAPQFDVPLIILHGEKDMHADISGSQEFFAKIKSEDKTLVIFPELYHEPWQEEKITRDQVLELVTAWTSERVLMANPPARGRLDSAGHGSVFSAKSARMSLKHRILSGDCIDPEGSSDNDDGVLVDEMGSQDGADVSDDSNESDLRTLKIPDSPYAPVLGEGILPPP